MKITYWSVNEYWHATGIELQKKGHDVQFNKVDEDTELIFIIGAHAAFKLLNHFQERYDNDRFIYKGKVAMCVLDIPTWRFMEDTWFNYYNQYKQLLKTSHYVLTISNETSKMLKLLWDIESKPLFALVNDILINKYKKKLPREHKILGVGRFVEHKCFHQLITALEGSDYKLVLVGRGGPLENVYKDMAKQLKVDLELKKDVSDADLVHEYCTAEVMIHPSIFEGLSLVQKEALLCDTPVLHSDLPVHIEFHGDKVATFKRNDIKDLKKAIEEKRWKKAETTHIKKLTIAEVTKKLDAWIKSLPN